MSVRNQPEPAFHESLRWGAVPLVVLPLVGVLCLAVAVVPFARGMHQQLIQGHPWGERPMSNGALWVLGPAVILLGLLPLFLLAARMTVEVRDGRVWVSILGKRSFPLSEITAAAVDEVSPMVGWGVRWTPGRLYYRVGSASGVALTLRSGKVVFIESARPTELLAAIEAGTQRLGVVSPRPPQ